MENEIQVLMNNYHGEDNTFIHKLSEESLFDFPLFWDYYNSVREIISFMVDGYFQGYLIDESNFDEELQNPLLSKEKVELEPSIIRLGFYREGFDIHAVGFKNQDRTYDIFLNEEEDKFLVDSKLSRREVQGTFIFSVSDSSTTYRVFHEWVMKRYSPYS
ncbi:hypothetical protein ACFVVQ_07760 [Paenibacillus chitinolyticus]|uniref:hypothetical protein n=1 Tax=Paenibacillus chitinolyticus TaxID=79263 RepID=UPI0036DA6313